MKISSLAMAGFLSLSTIGCQRPGHSTDLDVKNFHSLVPQSAHISDSQIVEGSEKAIFHLMDRHPSPGAKSNPDAQKYQDFHMDVIDTILKQHDRTTIVLDSLVDIATIPRFMENMEAAHPIDGKYELSTYTALKKYPGKIDLKGPESLDFNAHAIALRKITISAESLVETPKLSKCPTGEGPIPVDQIIDAYNSGRGLNPAQISCYCQVVAATEILNEYSNVRHIQAPKLEVTASLAADTDVVLIISGYQHSPETYRLLDESGQSWFGLEPKNVGPRKAYPKAYEDPRGLCVTTPTQ